MGVVSFSNGTISPCWRETADRRCRCRRRRRRWEGSSADPPSASPIPSVAQKADDPATPII